MEKYRIAVVGIGGVGGYYGGKLAQRFAADESHEVIFIARGEHKAAMLEHGLKIEMGNESFTAHPNTITDRSEQLGPLDLVLFCVKSYSLEQVAEQLAANIAPSTVLLPLLNGIDGMDYLHERFSGTTTLWGCVYIISSIKAAGIVQVQGKYNRLIWGKPELSETTRQKLDWLFTEAGINHEFYAKEVAEKVWEKFSFISPVGSLTSFTHKSMGDITNDPKLKAQLAQLIEELASLAKAKGLELPADIVQRNLAIVDKLPPTATSSMQRDVVAGKQSEVETLTGYIVREAATFSVDVPLYQEIYKGLKQQ
ncbi:ketopantoate reductase family protein [Pontibacter oryzae]|uniref:2-dehydropantoate 2-reductase n=1 Tax=Pontibacter oryzae TaxID=2304593 RepID=A0A399SI13_9BACT|nr:2-dehydropantoate 2-reductase [Pontibacter oryzae]RIJ41742.1 2-dehydropantoate 2-reductase [Pontibacter oryzae]